MAKIWKYHPAECELCGGDVEIFTDENEKEGYGYDGDPMRCIECEAKGQWVVFDEDDCYADFGN